MNKMKLLAGTATVTVLFGATSVAAGTPERNPNILRLVGHQTHATEVPPPGEDSFVGARFVGADQLLDGTRPVGTAGRSCEVVATAPDHTALFQCLITLKLPHGTIALQALPTLSEAGFEDFEAAVTGGTGRYRHARGSAAIANISETEIGYTVDLR